MFHNVYVRMNFAVCSNSNTIVGILYYAVHI